MNVLGRSLTLSGLLLGLAACSGGGGSSGGTMFIETCTLGCGSGQGGTQVSCQFNQAAVNQEIAVFFSEPVDPSSISSASFQIIDVTSGASPNGTRFLDPNNSRKVLFRPSVTFQGDGSISFGFDQDATYRVLLPGTSQGDPGPFIESVSGGRNSSRLSCDIRTSQPAVDLVPGAPTVQIFVKKANLATPDVNDFIPDVLVTGSPVVTDVWRGSDIKFVFNDLMNPATLANPATGDAAFVTVEVDLDGDLSTADRTPLFGSYVVQLDPVVLRTTMTFTPLNGIPSSGSLDPLVNDNGLPRKVVITVPNNLQDVAMNPLANPITASVVPEFVPIAPVTLPDADGENFTNSANQDVSHSAAGRTDLPMWANGRLTRAWGGGRGRLGELILRTGTTLTFDTDSQTFPLDLMGPHDLITNETPGVDYNALDTTDWPTITVTDGVFEFTNLLIEAGATLRFTGSQPVRLFVRGTANVLGLIDISGVSPAQHNSMDSLGGIGGTGGPNGGRGGDGGTRYDFNAGNSMLTVGAVDLMPGVEAVDGGIGQGVGQNAQLASGFGGQHWPIATPIDRNLNPPANMDLHISLIDFTDCYSVQSGRPGGGGAYATNGGAGVPMSPVALSDDGFPNTPGPGQGGGAAGNNTGLNIEAPGSPPMVRRLAFESGNLRGGSGGGGGGAGVFGTSLNNIFSCGLGAGSLVENWRDHSGASGGGGGGGMQFVSGGPSLSLSGRIDAGGGDGGSGIPAVPSDVDQITLRTKRAMPGGGGSGGAIRIQAVNFPDSALSTTLPPRLDISGGTGGMNSHAARGGDGGAGLVRLEGLNTSPTAAAVASLLAPTDVAIVGTNAQNVLSVGSWGFPRLRPESYTSAMSCWMRPNVSFFQLVFVPDSPGNPDPALRYGWDMNVLYGSPAQTYSYRDPANSPFAGQSFEQRFGNQFDGPAPGAYIIVRFQGARAAGDLTDLCNVDPALQLVPGSLTPWVTNASDLNQFSPQPNLIRFAVTFDFAATIGSEQAQIQGITGLKIRVQPD